MINEEELDFEKQMDRFYNSFVNIINEHMSPEWVNTAIKHLDFYLKHSVQGKKIRMRLLKELYDYEPPMHISFEKALDVLINDSEQCHFKNKLQINNVGKKSTLDLLEEYINKKGLKNE